MISSFLNQFRILVIDYRWRKVAKPKSCPLQALGPEVVETVEDGLAYVEAFQDIRD